MKNIFPKINFYEFELNNGLHVILNKNSSNPLVCVDIWYHVGSKDEEKGKTGFAHLFEHMMFQGSANVKKTEHFKYIQNSGGNVNGSTSQDRTNYYETVPSNHLETVLWLESDRMNSLNINQENFDNQRKVVIEEKRERYDNKPYGAWIIDIFNNAYKNHPYEVPPIGKAEDLNNAKLEYAKEFYYNFYNPSNSVLVISGDIDINGTKEKVEKYFSPIHSRKFQRKNFNNFTQIKESIKKISFDNIQIPGCFIGYKTPGLTQKENYAVNLLSNIIGEGKSSKLYKEIVYEKRLARSVNSFLWSLEIGSLLIINAFGNDNNTPEKKIDSIINNIDNILNDITQGSITEKELEKAKNKVISDYIYNLEIMINQSEILAYYYTYFKKPDMINNDIYNYNKVSRDEIIRVAAKYLNPQNRVILYYLPTQSNIKPY